MTRPLSDATTLLREAIKDVLDNATEPLTSVDISEAQQVRELGLDSTRIAQELLALYIVNKKPWPLKRCPSSRQRCKWEYYNPTVVKLAPKPRPTIHLPDPPVVNAVKSLDFAFNPVEFDPPAEPAPVVPVAIPAGVKAITLTIGGVSINIELNP